MPQEDPIELESVVLEALRNILFCLDTQDGHLLMAHLGAKLTNYSNRILPGDKGS